MSTVIKKGDKICVIAGKDKGKTGKVIEVFIQDCRAIVEGINLAKKHLRRRSENEPGGIKEIPVAISLSNIALFCQNCSRGVRFGVKLSSDKTKIRVCKRCGQAL